MLTKIGPFEHKADCAHELYQAVFAAAGEQREPKGHSTIIHLLIEQVMISFKTIYS